MVDVTTNMEINNIEWISLTTLSKQMITIHTIIVVILDNSAKSVTSVKEDIKDTQGKVKKKQTNI